MKENVLDGIWEKIKSMAKPQWKAAFWGCFIIGILTYAYTMTNHFLTYDSMWNMVSDQNMITSGRQFLMYACGISTFFDLPWVNGVIAIFFLGLTAVVVVEAFGIESRISAALTGGILVTFPAVISTFCFSYTVDGYMIAVFLAALAFLITDRKKKGFLWGILLLGISLGIYQGYYSLTILLCILRLLLDILEEKKIKDVLSKIARYLIMGVGAYVFYLITLKIMLKVQGLELSAYQGIDKLDGFSVSELPRGIWMAIRTFFSFLSGKNVLATTTAMTVSVWGLILLAIVIYAYLFVKKQLYKKIWNILIGFVLLAAMPIGATLVCVMSPDAYFHLLMRLPWALFFVFALALGERFAQRKEIQNLKMKIAVSVGMVALAAVMVFQFAVTANVVAFNMDKRFEKTNALCIRIIDRLEQMPGYETGMKVAILGGGVNQTEYPDTDLTSEYLNGYAGTEGSLVANSTDKFATFFLHYLNVTIETTTLEEEVEITQTDEFEKMDCFPNENSIQLIGDVWVIKLNG